MQRSPHVLILRNFMFGWRWLWPVLDRGASRYVSLSYGYQEPSLAILALFHLLFVQLRWDLILKIGYLSPQLVFVNVWVLL